MAERRMFTNKITESDAFLDMPLSAQSLYFHLCMNAMNKGWMNNAVSITRLIGAELSDLEMLVDSGFVIRDKDNIYWIVHWYENNGIGETAKKRNSYRYKKWRNEVIKRDQKCMHCGSTEKLEAHHIKPYARYPNLRYEVDNGMTLCKSCHKEHHRIYGSK